MHCKTKRKKATKIAFSSIQVSILRDAIYTFNEITFSIDINKQYIYPNKMEHTTEKKHLQNISISHSRWGFRLFLNIEKNMGAFIVYKSIVHVYF